MHRQSKGRPGGLHRYLLTLALNLALGSAAGRAGWLQTMQCVLHPVPLPLLCSKQAAPQHRARACMLLVLLLLGACMLLDVVAALCMHVPWCCSTQCTRTPCCYCCFVRAHSFYHFIPAHALTLELLLLGARTLIVSPQLGARTPVLLLLGVCMHISVAAAQCMHAHCPSLSLALPGR